jgi:hypothetical protein
MMATFLQSQGHGARRQGRVKGMIWTCPCYGDAIATLLPGYCHASATFLP